MDPVGIVIAVAVVVLVAYVFAGDIHNKLKGGQVAQIGQAVAQHVTAAIASESSDDDGDYFRSIVRLREHLLSEHGATEDDVKPLELLAAKLLHHKAKGAA